MIHYQNQLIPFLLFTGQLQTARLPSCLNQCGDEAPISPKLLEMDFEKKSAMSMLSDGLSIRVRLPVELLLPAVKMLRIFHLAVWEILFVSTSLKSCPTVTSERCSPSVFFAHVFTTPRVYPSLSSLQRCAATSFSSRTRTQRSVGSPARLRSRRCRHIV